MEITLHTKLEEEILYPAFRKAGGKEQDIMYHEAKEEHRTVDSLVLPDLKQTEPSSTEFSGRVKVVKELLEHHIEEEESEMFPQAKNCWARQYLKSWGRNGGDESGLQKGLDQQTPRGLIDPQ